MQFSIVIPTCNRNESLGLCLDRLAPGRQTLGASHYEVIVSDDSPGVGAEAFVASQYPWVQYVKGPRMGPAANRNCGAAMATADWLIFTDDDCLPDAHWLEAFAKATVEHPATQAFEGAICPDDWGLLATDMAECPVNTSGNCFWSANIMVARSLFQQLGGFEERFRMAANEDQELAHRIRQHSPIIFVPAAGVIHPVRRQQLVNKIRALKASEDAQMLLRKLQGYNRVDNWLDGIQIHTKAGYQAFKKGKFKTLLYNIIGAGYRIFAAPFRLP